MTTRLLDRGTFIPCATCGAIFERRRPRKVECDRCVWRRNGTRKRGVCRFCGSRTPARRKLCEAPACRQRYTEWLKNKAREAGARSAIARRDRRYDDLRAMEAAWRSGQRDGVNVIKLIHEVRELRDRLEVARLGCVVVRR
ncbi:MAG: hypothetical protein WC986_13730 [Elusimicrobiota bacterium]